MTTTDEVEIVVEDDLETIYAEFRSRGWSDGLPIIPPTPERVARMLASSTDAEASLGSVPPSFAPALVRKAAVSAVMAGCIPEFFPAVTAAIGAVIQPDFNLGGVQSTTSSTAPMLIFNGPAAQAMGISGGVDCLGGSHHANATVGRAVRLALIALGGATPGVGDLATLGQPAKISCCLAENETQSPWRPLSEDRGFAPGASTVTAFASTGVIEVRDSDSQSAQDLLTTIAHSMTPAGYMSANNAGEKRPEALVLMTPDHARQVDGQGMTKDDARQFLWARARRPLTDFAEPVAAQVAGWRRERGVDTRDVTVTLTPDDVHIVVAGGSGAKSMFVPTWGGWTQSTTVEVTVS